MQSYHPARRYLVNRAIWQISRLAHGCRRLYTSSADRTADALSLDLPESRCASISTRLLFIYSRRPALARSRSVSKWDKPNAAFGLDVPRRDSDDSSNYAAYMRIRGRDNPESLSSRVGRNVMLFQCDPVRSASELTNRIGKLLFGQLRYQDKNQRPVS